MKKRMLMIFCCILTALAWAGMAEEAVTLPAGTMVVEEEAFYGDESLRRVELPAGIAEIGARAFSHCGDPAEAARQYIVPDGVTAAEDAFEECRARIYLNGEELPFRVPYLTYRVAEEGVTVTGLADSSMTNLVIPDIIEGKPVIAIGGSAFRGKTALKSVTLPATVGTVGGYAFENCTGLETAVLPEGITAIGEKAFYGCDGLLEVVLPSTLREMGKEVFYSCDALRRVTIRDGLTVLPESAFQRCASLAELTLPATLTEIGPFAFSRCSALAAVELPDALTSIGIHGFSFCSALTDVRFPAGLKAIGNDAFQSTCRNQETIVRFRLPEGIETYGTYVFTDSGAAPVVVRGSQIEAAAVRDHYLFAYADSPDFIYQNWYYPGVSGYQTGLYAYAGSDAPIRLPDDVIGVRKDGFAGLVDTGLVCAQRSATAAALSSAELNYTFPGHEDFRYRVIDNVLYVMGYAGTGTEIVIPPADAYLAAGTDEQIRQNAFRGNETVTRAVIPEGITEVGDSAFLGCVNLTEVSFPRSLRVLKNHAFEGCGSASAANYFFMLPPDLEAIAGGMGAGWDSFHGVTGTLVCAKDSNTAYLLSDIGYNIAIEGHHTDGLLYRYENREIDGVTKRRLYVYLYKGSAETVEIPGDIGVYGVSRTPPGGSDSWYSAFNGNKTLKRIVIPEGVVIIQDSAFKDCSKLSSVSLPESLRIIKNHAFENTGSGRFVVQLPAGITEMTTGNGAGWASFNGSTAVLVAPERSWVAAALFEDWWQFYYNLEPALIGDWNYVVKKDNDDPNFKWNGNI